MKFAQWAATKKRQFKTAHGGTRVYPNCHVASVLASLSPALCMLTLGSLWKTLQPPSGLFFGRSKLGRSINCLTQKVCHIELGPHNCLITHFQLHHLFSIAPSPQVQQYPSAGTSILALWKKRESIWHKALWVFFVGRNIVRSWISFKETQDWSKQSSFCHVTKNTYESATDPPCIGIFILILIANQIFFKWMFVKNDK